MVQLKVYETNGTQHFIDMYEAEPIKLNLSIEDIQTVSPASVFSRTFRVPSNNKNNKFFKNAFLINGLDYDVTVKLNAEIILDGALMHEGHIRLNKIYVNNTEDKIDYECVFFGETRNLASAIGDKTMNLLQLDDEIELTYTNITNSWSGQDIVYPLVDFGNTYNNGVNVETSMVSNTNIAKRFTTSANPLTSTRFKPIIRVRKILDKLFEQYGFSYESNFIKTNDRLKDVYLTAFGGDETTIAGNTSKNTTESKSDNRGYLSNSVFVHPVIIKDANNNLDPVEGYYTAPQTGTYTFETTTKIDKSVSSSALFYRVFRGGSLFTQFTAPTSNNTRTMYFRQDIPLITGDKVYVGGNVQLVINQTYRIDSTFSCTSAPGESILSNLLDDKYKQIDFLKDLITMFRLVLVPSKTKAKHFIIEPWVDYIGSGKIIDLSKEIDHNKDILIEPLFNTQNKKIEFSTGESGDWVNKFHKDSTKYVYGYKEVDTFNELLSGKKEIKITTANIIPAVIDGENTLSTFAIPQLFQYGGSNNSEKKALKSTSMFVAYNGLAPISTPWYFLNDTATSIAQNTYPLISSIAQIGNNAVCLTWNKDQEYAPSIRTHIQTTIPNGYDTRSTIFDEYWGDYISDLYNKFSRKLTMYIRWTNKILINLNFSDIIFIDGTYYYIESINDIVLGEEDFAQTILVKLNNYSTTSIPTFVWYTLEICGTGTITYSEMLPINTFAINERVTNGTTIYKVIGINEDEPEVGMVDDLVSTGEFGCPTTPTNVWYQLERCSDNAIFFSEQLPSGTYSINERLTNGGVTYKVVAVVTSLPSGVIITGLTSTGNTGCPTTGTTVWYSLTNCNTGEIAYTGGVTQGTYSTNERLTTTGTDFWVVTGFVTNMPTGTILNDAFSTGNTGCPSTTTGCEEYACTGNGFIEWIGCDNGIYSIAVNGVINVCTDGTGPTVTSGTVDVTLLGPCIG
jgi:hypothetical protein